MFTRVLPPDELRIPRTGREVVLDQVVTDCEAAAALLPMTQPAASVGRATRGAAYALAAKARLYQGRWADVVGLVGKVKDLGLYDLVPDYEDNFRKETQNNAESVWEIQHANLELGVGNFLNQWWMSKKVNGYGFAEVTEDFVNAFEAGDPRRRFTVASRDEPYFGTIYKNSFSSTRYSPRKYLQDTSAVSQPADGDINYTAIRFAEVLLWEAEALNELGRAAEAQVPLERVRARARAQADDPATTLPMVTLTDVSAMRDAIRHERQVELGFELHRYFDLVRWGIADDLIPFFQAGKHEVFPLPQTEIDLNPALSQNPGY